MNSVTPAKAIVVDDHPLFRRGVVELLSESKEFEVVSSFGSAVDLIAAMPITAPDLLLLDYQMPEMSGIEALKILRPQLPQSKIVMLTVSMDSHSLLEAITLGADGYLLKDTESEQILKQLASVMQGKIAINESGITLLAQSIRSNGISPNPPEADMQNDEALEALKELTERERQTLKLISKGLSNKLIARELGISDGTVKVYVKNLLRKLGLRSRLELAAWSHNHSFAHSDEN
ncbi:MULTISPECIES: response regulator [Thiomicrorhabdus]|uniref:Response regulator n=1 Tax=Thiomicrorhabdus heinhorstiae TaxID=2748010 RepID=A0ABS0BU81_9GAMM|nr:MULTISPECIES: response regulator [Thiomicrorhabdus]MBF6057397.1 response regulator [Thiomicrorhabdus heinhorstiae]